MAQIDNYIINKDCNLRTTIKKMDEGGIGFISIIDNDNCVVGIITDGDFRRSILNGISLEESVEKVMNRNFKYLNKGYSKEEVNNLFTTTIIRHIPILHNNKLIDIITEDDFYSLQIQKKQKKINLPVIIMAGGKGTRLDPFTRILPKPLIPIGDKPIIEIIMDEYAKYGIKDFYISINHKGKMIKLFFEDYVTNYKINYIEEKKSLGTAGAIGLLKKSFESDFFVSNCDILIKNDYIKIYEFHKKRNYDLTIVASMKHFTIPYGVCEIGHGGILTAIKEKPEFDFLVNTGMYLMKPNVLKFIPKNVFCNMTDLINDLISNNMSIGVFPISEKSYIDVGQWEEYKYALEKVL